MKKSLRHLYIIIFVILLFILFAYYVLPNHKLGQNLDISDQNIIHNIIINNKRNIETEISSQILLKFMKDQNKKSQDFIPSSKFPDIKAVFIIQIHNRPDYLRELISSLEKAKNINETLLIFSGDYYSETIEEILSKIKFAQWIHIHYPFSIQAYPNQFPGTDIKDCTTENIFSGCINEDWKDTYGNFRSAHLSQIKLHWLWKIQFTMNNINCLKDFQGPFLLLEEDYIVLEDILQILEILPKTENDLQMITIGSYSTKLKFDNVIYAQKHWVSSEHNIGMVFNRAIWKSNEKHLTEGFCSFDDYNWDWSMTNVLSTYNPELPLFHLAESPRVLHIGSCGEHAKGTLCNAKVDAQKNYENLSIFTSSFYPDTLKVVQKIRSTANYQNNGGFKDPRDVNLCKHILNEPSNFDLHA